jgi:hypothetical protein
VPDRVEQRDVHQVRVDRVVEHVAADLVARLQDRTDLDLLVSE